MKVANHVENWSEWWSRLACSFGEGDMDTPTQRQQISELQASVENLRERVARIETSATPNIAAV